MKVNFCGLNLLIMYQREVFIELMFQFISGEISPAGKTQLSSMLDDPQYADDLDFVLRENYNNVNLSEVCEESSQHFIKSLKERIATLENDDFEYTPNRLLNWRRLAVAASVILFVGFGYFMSTKNTVTKAIVENKKTIIEPGRNGAILTLANGTEIVLDSLKNGLVANQSNTIVSKKDGELVYTKGNNSRVAYNTMSTPRGRQYSVVLSDGTRVWLNASSSITFPTSFVLNQRKVSITGEAYFEVAKDKEHPFVVSVKDVEVKVLGTHFNINSYADEANINTTLLEGSVLVCKKDKKIILKPGQQAAVKNAGGIEVKMLGNFSEVMGWKNGVFYFENASLETVLRQLSRWYDVEIIFEKGVSSRSFNGELPRDLELSQILKILEGNNVHFKVEGKILRVLP
jgi:transmembrane sensor